eukprot:CAMPEP_0184858292 /NCGR_PEP_ID=MMETSP0580-20130426/3416_1 /TAXON_ID=1118495 /ORGANISM="Dactyliosolen fragilissimus" /LENGTH=1008 /DNA_ID=CAMNT_0027354375 /DNA_START=495 /DNA_END=3521 /DNA_ORIENTATION=+
MSRRRGEFEHRTSIFEGAFRAWSHLGGLDPKDLETKSAAELDPLNYPILNDQRLAKKGKNRKDGDSSKDSDVSASNSKSNSNSNSKSNSKEEDGNEDMDISRKDDEKKIESITDETKNDDNDHINDGGDGNSGKDKQTSVDDKINNCDKDKDKDKDSSNHNMEEEQDISHPSSMSTSPVPSNDVTSNTNNANQSTNPSKRFYPYEALPRSGLAHPFVQAILSPWLGPDADEDAIQLGLTTLRTWWQHRRKGESGSAMAALGTEKMKGVVEGYTRHFFNLAHCLIVNDGEQPPRTLMGKLRCMDQEQIKNFKKNNLNNKGPSSKNNYQMDDVEGEGKKHEDILSPLERLHAAQQRKLREHGVVPGSLIDMKGKCVPGKIDFIKIVDKVRKANQLAHIGSNGLPTMMNDTSNTNGGLHNEHMNDVKSANIFAKNQFAMNAMNDISNPHQENDDSLGDPLTTPVVFVSQNGDIQIAMNIEGITCAHCVKIIETVLKGCNGTKSPIPGLMDAAADRLLSSVIIKIDKSSSAKRVANEAARNLSMVGYIAKPKEMDLSIHNTGKNRSPEELTNCIRAAFDIVATTERSDVFNWNSICSCPDNGILREDCERHSQMNKRIFEAFEKRQRKVAEFMAGCGKKYGLGCTCGPNCTCKGCARDKNGVCVDGINNSTKCSTSSSSQSWHMVHPTQQLQRNQKQQCLGTKPDGTVGQESQNTMVASLNHQQSLQAAQLHQHQMSYMKGHITAQDLLAIQQQQAAMMMSMNSDNLAVNSSNLTRNGLQREGASLPNIMHSLDPDMTNATAASERLRGGHSATPLSGLTRNTMGSGIDGQMSANERKQRQHSFTSWGSGSRGEQLHQMNHIGGRMRPRNSFISAEGSTATFGRTMSGLSALSIDWENMEDFDVNIDHSAHINNHSKGVLVGARQAAGTGLAMTSSSKSLNEDGIMAGCAMLNGGECNCGPTCMCSGCPVHDKPAAPPVPQGAAPPRRRSSLKKNIPVDPDATQNMQVSFKV